jgi:FkbM family methyltransferase
MQWFDWIRRAGRRLRKITAFGRTGLAIPDKLKMLVIGYARGHNFGSNDVISRVGRTLFPEIAVRPSSLGGLTLHLDPSDLSHLAVADEILLQKVYDLGLVPFTPDLILDCGAHIGMFTLLAATRFPKSRLVAFEPDPENCRWIEKQICANRLQAELLSVAVSTHEGKALFQAGRGCGGALIEEPGQTHDAITVNTLDLGTFIGTLRPQRLLLKLDVEGAEEKLLPAIVDVLPQDCVLFFETHRGEQSWQPLSALLREHGLAVTPIRQRDVYTDGVAIRSSGSNTR